MLNGNLKSLLLFWENLAVNRRYRQFVEGKDLQTFRKRATNEGLTFLTVALPELGKALDSFHSNNVWEPPKSFSHGKDGLPHFLRKAIKAALAGNSDAVDCVRQLSYVFYKLEVHFEDAKRDQFLDQFIQTDLDLGSIDYAASTPLPGCSNTHSVDGDFTTASLVNVMRELITEVLLNVEPYDISPRHGSGATACHTPNHKKWDTIRYFTKLDQIYDYSSHFFLSPTHLADDYEKLRDAPESDPVARVCLVPKDSRGPRVISCEPAELMYIQQGIMSKLYGHLETHNLTRGYINFSNQEINRELAKTGSITGEYSTLDLKDASDRVSLALIRLVFPPNWVEALESCRSEETVLPDGRRVKLNKFAPMGSACCFPVEALVFWACAVASIQITELGRFNPFRHPNENLTDRVRFMTGNYGKAEHGWKTLRRIRHYDSERGSNYTFYNARFPEVFVYGDDIICHRNFSTPVMVGLEAIGLLVNSKKSYVAGPFRESCGGDYHYGNDVTPVRVRNFFSNVSTGLQAGADLGNELISKFGYEDAHSCLRVIEDEVGYLYPRTLVPLPVTLSTTPGASNDAHFKRRWNEKLQRFEHRILAVRYHVSQKREPDWFELLRKQLTGGTAQARVETDLFAAWLSGCKPLQHGEWIYANQLSIVEKRLDPGWYAEAHSAHTKWVWAWLG